MKHTIRLLTFDQPDINGRIYSSEMGPEIVKRLKQQASSPVDSGHDPIIPMDLHGMKLIDAKLVDNGVEIEVEA